MSAAGPGGGVPPEEEGRPGPATAAVTALIWLAGGAFLALLVTCGWYGTRFALFGAPPLAVQVQGEISAPVRFLSVLLEGPSGVVALGAASALVLASALGLGPLDSRPARRVASDTLARLRRETRELSRDLVRWTAELPRREGRWHALALAATVLGGLALRAHYLSQPMRYDEAFTLTQFAARPLELGLSRYTFPNNHLLHTLLVHLTTAVAGESPAALRLPAFLAGVAVVPASYAAWDALGDADDALVAAAVAAASSPLVLYSTNARGYSLVVLLGLLLVPLAARLLRRRDYAAWGLFVVLSAAAFHAIPVALYPFGAVLAWLVLAGRPGGLDSDPQHRRPRAELLKEAATAVLAVGIAVGWLYLPAVQRSGVEALLANRFVTPDAMTEVLRGLPGFFEELWSTWTRGWPTPAAVGVGVLAAAGLAGEAWAALTGRSGGRRPGGKRSSFPLTALLWSLALLVATRRIPDPRVWLFVVPIVGLLTGRGFRLLPTLLGRPLRSRVAGPAAAVLLVAGLGGSVAATSSVARSEATGTPYGDGEALTRTLGERMGPEDTVLATSGVAPVIRYWFRRHGLPPERVNRLPGAGGRLFIVVHRAEGQTLDGVLARIEVSPDAPVRVREVARLEESTLYLLTPRR